MATPDPVSETATDTIAAISTPPGRGGIGIVRLSGPQATAIAAQLARPHQPLEHARARLSDVLDMNEAADAVQEAASATGEAGGARQGAADPEPARIDEALVTFFGAP